jgi:hypothetical protein
MGSAPIMTSRGDFTSEEWALLVALPREAAIAAAVADADDPLDATKAIVAAFKELVAGAATYPDNALIADVLLELRTGQEGPEDQSETIEVDAAQRDRQLAGALDHARRANETLRATADPDEADEYRTWILAIGREAVRAATSGGFLGIGAERVTETEAEFMGKLRAALGVTA